MNKPKRRWLRYSLRTLLIVFTLIAVVLGVHFNQIHQQWQAVNAIRLLGGEVMAYTEDFNHLGPPQSRYEYYLGNIVGLWYVHSVKLKGQAINDDVLKQHVLRFKWITSMDLCDTSVTERGLADLKSLKSLKGVRLKGSLTHRALVELKPLASLTYVLFLHDQGNFDIAKAVWEPTTCDFVEMPLEDFVSYLKGLHNFEITFDAEELLAAGMDAKNVSITAKIKGLPFSQVLDNLLDSHEMGWIIRKGTVVVTTREIAASSRVDREALYELKAALPQLEIVVD